MAERFWSNHMLEPKRNYRFRMYIGQIDYIYVKTAARPGWELGVEEHDYLNHKFKFPGKISFEPIEVEIVEEVTNEAMNSLLTILTKSGYSWVQREGKQTIDKTDMNTVSKRRAVEALTQGTGKGALLEELNSDGKVICRYTLHNPWISKVSPDGADYSNEGLTGLSLTVTFDYCKIDTTPNAK